MIKKVFLAPVRLILWIILLPLRFLGWVGKGIGGWLSETRFGKFFNEVPEDHSIIDSATSVIEDPSGFFEQIEIARAHLFRAVAALALAIIVSFIFTQKIVDFLALPVGGIGSLQAIEVTESIGVFMRVAMLSGFALATPYIAFEIWYFIAPGLMPKARKLSLLIIPFGFLFFIGGVVFSYQFLLPTSLPFLLDFMGVKTALRPQSYFTFITGILFWIGIAFEFPLVIFGTSYIGLTKPKMLLKHWRIAVLLIAIIAAMVTPTVDPINMSLVMIPMILLYFLSIFFSWLALVSAGKTEQTESV